MNKEQIFIVEDGALVDEFASVKPGEPFRLFKFGDIYKGGRKRTVSRQKPFSLPKFRAPIKLGSHKEETPAGGFITGLEYREDGVWAIPEWNDEGMAAMEKGAYRYHSPEVIWEGGYIEDADTGTKIEGPLIVGVALTHTPHLGESAALYTYQEYNMTEQMETVSVPKDFWDGIKDFFSFKKAEPEPDPEPELPEEYQLAIKERDEYKAQIEQHKAAEEQKELFTAIRAEFDTEEYGAAFQQLGDEAVERLAKLDAEERAWFIEKFKALSAQVSEEEKLTQEIGEDEVVPHTAEAFDAAIKAYAKEHGMTYPDAAVVVGREKPELLAAYKGGK